MSRSATMRWGDGYLIVEAKEIPESLTKQLKYWHRSLERDEYSHRMVSTGEYRTLFQITPELNANNEVTQVLSTMTGFGHRIKQYLKDNGYSVTYVDERTPLPEPDFASAFEGMRDYQMTCVYTAVKSGGGVIACPTGWGKTHIMAAIIKAFPHEELLARGAPQVVLTTPEKDITFKDYKDMVKLLPDREVGLIMSGKNIQSNDVQVITMGSLHKLDFDDVGLFIVDEVHTAASEKRSESILKARKAACWGVSATPTGRFDGRDLITEGLFGPVVYRRTYAQGVSDGALVPIKVYWVRVPPPEMGLERFQNYKQRNSKYRHGVTHHPGRNKQIVDIMQRTPDSMQVLCIMQQLKQMNEIVGLDGGRIEIVHAETSQDSLTRKNCHNLSAVSAKGRRDIYDRMESGELKQVMSTYVYKQGVNFPNLKLVINAGGGGGEIAGKQIPGRATRPTEDKDVAYVVDFWHNWDVNTGKNNRDYPGTVHKDDKSREKYYTELGFDQVWVDSIDDIPFLEDESA